MAERRHPFSTGDLPSQDSTKKQRRHIYHNTSNGWWSGYIYRSNAIQSTLGVYECLAVNDNGTAVSERINFQAAFIQLFEEQPVEIVKVEIGDPYAHNCTSPPSNPHARLFWILMVWGVWVVKWLILYLGHWNRLIQYNQRKSYLNKRSGSLSDLKRRALG